MRWEVSELLPLLALLLPVCCHGYNWSNVNLPDSHMPYFFRNNPDVKQLCVEDENCPFKSALSVDRCWGYEEKCGEELRLSSPQCPDSSRGWTQDKPSQVDNFWKGADFGYVLERRNEMTVMCSPQKEGDSLLECAKYARYCRAKNIYFDLRKVQFDGTDRFKEDFLTEGQVGGHCKLHKDKLKAEREHKSALQSWFAEVEHYSSLPFQPIDNQHCDIIIDKPTIFMKLDAGINLFHHYCDFINFYTSQHVNNSFSQDVILMNWDTSRYAYRDLFKETFQAFTYHPMQWIRDYQGKRVCVQDAVFPLLPRLRWGMFYNMPLIPGCYGSSLFQAFSTHLMHRLDIPQDGPLDNKIRITVLDRQSKYRNIMNQDELVSALKTVGEYDVQLVAYGYREMPFLEQVKKSHNSDIFIGMHGAGLTHMLFQPEWASVIELFNCGDINCYYDLARLRGVKYFTWEKMELLTQEDEVSLKRVSMTNSKDQDERAPIGALSSWSLQFAKTSKVMISRGHHPTMGAHQKFTNYAFDVIEFMRLVAKAADHVRSHPAFIEARKERQATMEKQNAREEL